ncbi:hypothetical protein ZEAMMB73_Zm00001d015252 [Zea mays]|uniref:Uncharacterized protein n=2 Tax=Zea mays TaxID=4577 RepID=A0A1D6H0S5_MAIZE|nr:hypothetical protein ZEAMMB73_Zm00001d015252 [Zea mays]
MEGSSLQHVSTDNTSQKDSMDDQVYMQPEDNRMRRLSEDTLLCDSEESLTKRKLDFSQPIGGDNSTATLIPYPTITGNEDFVPSSSDVAQVGDGDDDVTNFCLTRREPPTCDVAQVGDGDDDVTNFCLIRREPPTSPFIDSCVDTTELAEDYSSFPCALPSVVNFSDIDSFLDGCDQLFENQTLDIISPVEIHPSMDTVATLEDLFLKTTRQALANVLDGLNAHTLRDPVRCASLRLASSCLTGQFASIARIKAMLDKLITISEQLQRTYSNFEVARKQDEQSTAKIKQALDVQREALRTVDDELASAEKQRAETMTTIEKLNQILMEVEQKRARLEEMRSTSDLEVRKLEQDLCDAIADASKKAIDVFQKETTELNQQAEQLLIDLNSCRCRSSSN